MPRALTDATAAEAAKPVVAPLVFVELAFASGTERVWSGHGTLDWDGRSWTGLGSLGSISAMEETTDLRASGITLQLSGVDPTLLGASLLGKAEYRRRRVKVWLGFADPDTGAVIAEPFLAWSGRMDVMTIEEGETLTIQMTAENDLIDLERPRTRRYLPDDQKAIYPGDLGLDYIASLQDAQIEWPDAD